VRPLTGEIFCAVFRVYFVHGKKAVRSGVQVHTLR
jgi:hypothetical protein